MRVTNQMRLLVWESEQIGLFAELSWENVDVGLLPDPVQGDESGTPMHRVVNNSINCLFPGVPQLLGI